MARSRQEIETLRAVLYGLAEQYNPLTIRSLFYQAVSVGVIDKTEREYKGVVRYTGQMRKEGELPFEWLVDAGRFERKVATWSGPADILEAARDSYRRNLWENQPTHVEIWCEKDAVVGVIEQVTEDYQVPLYSCKGYASLSMIYEAINKWPEEVDEVCIRYFGDRDPSGRDIPRFIERTLWEMDPINRPLRFDIAAVTDEQIALFDLPTRPTKRTDSRAASFEGESVELDAFNPNDLRNLVEDAIAGEIDDREWQKSVQQQTKDKKQLRRIIKEIKEKDEHSTAA